MRIALIYDYLNQYGGGERVLETFLEIFPEADLFTLFFDPRKTFGRFSKNRIKQTSFLNKKIVVNHHRLFIPFMPKAAESLNLKNTYDLIISIGAGYSKGISYENSYHLSYCFTPLRYAWEDERYLKDKFKNNYLILKPFLSLLISYLRKWDMSAGQKPDEIITLSTFIADKIKQYYHRDSSIVYPPVDLSVFYPENPYKNRSFFLAAGRLMFYKKFDLIVKAFNELKLPLKIVGRGPELKNLIKLNTSPETHFITSFVSQKELRNLYGNAKAFIFPQIEDFGLVAAEAIACGTPVIAFKEGGVKDIIEENKNGIFLPEQTPEAIISAVNSIPSKKFESLSISETAAKFSKERFKENILKKINGFAF